jgi:hypothetical protein
VAKALEHIREEKTEDIADQASESKESSGRRTTTNYKVVSKQEE